MSWEASQKMFHDAANSIDGIAIKLKSAVQSERDSSAAGTSTRETIIRLKRICQRAEDEWANIKASVDNVGLRDHIREQKSKDGTFDVDAEYVAMRNATTSLRTWIHSNLPTDAGSGAVLERISNADGSYSPLTIPAGNALAVAFRTEADALIAAIG